jgi:hypothetical protein
LVACAHANIGTGASFAFEARLAVGTISGNWWQP